MQFLYRVVIQELFTVPSSCHLPGSPQCRCIDGISPHERKTHMLLSFENVSGIDNACHGCEGYWCFDYAIIDEQPEALECIHHKFIAVAGDGTNAFAYHSRCRTFHGATLVRTR